MNVYCVILCRGPLIDFARYPRTKRFYLRADTADRAVLTASEENPQWRAVGVEPNDLFGSVPKVASSSSTPEISDAA